MVEQPAWLFLKEGRIGMNEHRLLLFHCAVAAASQPCCVVEVASSDGLEAGRKGSQWERLASRDPRHSTFLVQAVGELEEGKDLQCPRKKAQGEPTFHRERGMFAGRWPQTSLLLRR